MNRIRSITAAGVLTGATVLGGVGLAGASDDAELEDTTSVDQTELTTGEPEAPTLPEPAADAAQAALDERFAGASADDQEPSTAETEAETEAESETETETSDDVADPAGADHPENHGADVSAAAQDDEGGPGHGEDVREVARTNGAARAEQARAER